MLLILMYSSNAPKIAGLSYINSTTLHFLILSVILPYSTKERRISLKMGTRLMIYLFYWSFTLKLSLRPLESMIPSLPCTKEFIQEYTEGFPYLKACLKYSYLSYYVKLQWSTISWNSSVQKLCRMLRQDRDG
jgi:hypothetical protein